jgi:curved DNA-binding protein CbpA
MGRDFYAILGVSRNATSEQIRQRFLQLTREKHPDRVYGEGKRLAESEFQAITQAFNVLSSPARRRDHDLELMRPPPTTGRDPAQEARVYLQRGAKAFKAKSYTEAAENFDRATQVDPGNSLAWHHLARACREQSRWLPRAAAAIVRACELEPMRAEYHKLAGEILAQAGQKEKAARHYRQALQWGGIDSEVEAALEELGGKKRKSLFGGFFGKMK